MQTSCQDPVIYTAVCRQHTTSYCRIMIPRWRVYIVKTKGSKTESCGTGNNKNWISNKITRTVTLCGGYSKHNWILPHKPLRKVHYQRYQMQQTGSENNLYCRSIILNKHFRFETGPWSFRIIKSKLFVF